ncbi:MAG TPA: hypothetical protein VJ841_02360 [Candidatus Saccharimonadales bacterium]|nr:hypothetical protein [Candidatus Saccharimonadales bacterium]
MAVSSTTRALLFVCAQHISAGEEDRTLDLFSCRGELYQKKDECIADLIANVERLSNGVLTIRKVPYAMIKHAPGGISNLFVAVMPASSPKDRVKVEGAVPYIISPGAGIGCTRAEWKD